MKVGRTGLSVTAWSHQYNVYPEGFWTPGAGAVYMLDPSTHRASTRCPNSLPGGSCLCTSVVVVNNKSFTVPLPYAWHFEGLSTYWNYFFFTRPVLPSSAFYKWGVWGPGKVGEFAQGPLCLQTGQGPRLCHFSPLHISQSPLAPGRMFWGQHTFWKLLL